MLAGVPLAPPSGFALIGAGFVAGLALAPGAASSSLGAVFAMAALCWGAWVVVYFSAGAFAEGRARTLPSSLEAHLPFLPSAALIYLGVHPLFVGSFFSGLRSERLRRYGRAALLVVAASGACWFLLPIELPRPTLPPDAPGFGEFALRTIWGSDPSANCLPSTHCAMAVLAAFGVGEVLPRWRPWLVLTVLAIGVSTVVLRQHYVVDVLSGWLLGALAGAWFLRGKP